MMLSTIIIAGCDEVALLAAAVLAQNLRGVEITLLDAVAPDVRYFAESSGAKINSALALAGIAEREFVGRTGATLKLGDEFRDWAAPGQAFIHSLGHYGVDDVVEFHHAALKLRTKGHQVAYDEYSLGAAAARQGKFLRAADYEAPLALPELHSGLHFNVALAARLLYAQAKNLGVRHVAEQVHSCERDHTGNITALITESGKKLQADFYIDATASKRLLLGQFCGVGFQGWADYIPVDSCIYALKPNQARFDSLSRTSAGANYWLRKIPLRDMDVVELHFSRRVLTPEQAQLELRRYLQSDDISISPPVFHNPGRAEQFWVHNCLALGESALVLDRTSHSAFAIAQLALARFLELFPRQSVSESLIAEYNRLMIAEAERLRDYHCLHYHLLPAQHPLHLPAENLASDLKHKLNLFKAVGRIPVYENEPVAAGQWIALLLGMNAWPQAYDPVADIYPDDYFYAMQQDMRGAIAELVKQMPDHYRYLATLLA